MKMKKTYAVPNWTTDDTDSTERTGRQHGRSRYRAPAWGDRERPSRRGASWTGPALWRFRVRVGVLTVAQLSKPACAPSASPKRERARALQVLADNPRPRPNAERRACPPFAVWLRKGASPLTRQVHRDNPRHPCRRAKSQSPSIRGKPQKTHARRVNRQRANQLMRFQIPNPHRLATTPVRRQATAIG